MEEQKETLDELKEYREQLANLTEEEKKERDLYLKRIGPRPDTSKMTAEELEEFNKIIAKNIPEGESIQGPTTGFASIDKPWLFNYTDEAIKTKLPEMKIYDYMYQCSSQYKDNVALEYFGVKIKYKDFFAKIEETAKALKEMGVKKGEIVSICLPNCPEMGYVFYALNRIGAISNWLDPRANEPTLKESIVNANSTLLITMDAVYPKFKKFLSETEIKSTVYVSALNSLPKVMQTVAKLKDKSMNVKIKDEENLTSWASFIKNGKKFTGEIDSEYVKDEPAVIAYTGGTTGIPKGVIQTNDAFVAMVVMHQLEELNFEVGDKSLDIAPPWTFYGLSNAFNVHLCLGLHIQLIPVLGPDDLDKLVVKNKPAHLMAVPSCLVSWEKGTAMKNENLSYLKSVVVGAEKMAPSFEESFNKFLEEHHCEAKVTKGYGMTEVNSAATYTKPGSNAIGTVGIPLVFNNVTAFDPETGKEARIGETAEIGISGPTVMQGYFGVNASKTADVVKEHEDGTSWAHTKDLGHIDELGRTYVDGRIKRMIVKKGFKIFAPEVEKAISLHPAVEMCAVVGVEDENNGCIAKACVVLKENSKNNAEQIKQELIELCNKNLYDYEIPDIFQFRDELPLVGIGKIDFRALETEEATKEKVRQR